MTFELQPTLTGRLLGLRPLLLNDHDALDSGGALLATDLATGSVIGSSRYYGYDPKSDEVEIGWTFLARSRWGGRTNRELKDLMLRHAFRFVGHVVFIIDPANLRSQRAVVKFGAIA